MYIEIANHFVLTEYIDIRFSGFPVSTLVELSRYFVLLEMKNGRGSLTDENMCK